MIITYFYLNCGVPIGSGIKAVPIGSGVKAVPIGSDVKAEPIGSGVEAVPIGSGVKAAPIGSGVKAAPIGRYLISRPTQHTQFIEIGGGGSKINKNIFIKGGNLDPVHPTSARGQRRRVWRSKVDQSGLVTFTFLPLDCLCGAGSNGVVQDHHTKFLTIAYNRYMM